MFGLSFSILSLSLILATEVKGIADYLPYPLSLPKGTSSHQWTRQAEADTTKNIDILILGSSLAQSIDVRPFQKLNLRAFNLGSGSQTPIQTNYFLQRHLDSFNPKLILWDVNPSTFSNLGLESTIDLIANSQDGKGMLPLLIRTGSELGWASFVKRSILRPFEAKDMVMPLRTDISQYYYGGYMEALLEAPEIPMEADETYSPLLEIQDQIFRKDLKLLQGKNIPVILIYSPKSKSFIQNFKNQENWFTYFNTLVEEELAMKFLNLNEVFIADSLNRTYFYDLGHLTQKGAKAYNQILLDSLKSSLLGIAN